MSHLKTAYELGVEKAIKEAAQKMAMDPTTLMGMLFPGIGPAISEGVRGHGVGSALSAGGLSALGGIGGGLAGSAGGLGLAKLLGMGDGGSALMSMVGGMGGNMAGGGLGARAGRKTTMNDRMDNVKGKIGM